MAKPKTAEPRATGRPTSYTKVMAERICERLSDGESLRSICLGDKMPSKTTVFRWLRQFDSFRDQYARAREAQADAIADEILDIADDGSNDFMGEDEKYNGDAVQRSRLRVDARKWFAGKLAPKKYGDSTMVKHADADGEKLEMDDTARATRLAAIFAEIDQRRATDVAE